MQQQAGQAAASEKKEPDRTEEIRDPETGITVFNHYKNNKLISSEMRKGRQKTYEVEYDAQGRIIHSRNLMQMAWCLQTYNSIQMDRLRREPKE